MVMKEILRDEQATTIVQDSPATGRKILLALLFVVACALFFLAGRYWFPNVPAKESIQSPQKTVTNPAPALSPTPTPAPADEVKYDGKNFEVPSIAHPQEYSVSQLAKDAYGNGYPEATAYLANHVKVNGSVGIAAKNMWLYAGSVLQLPCAIKVGKRELKLKQRIFTMKFGAPASSRAIQPLKPSGQVSPIPTATANQEATDIQAPAPSIQSTDLPLAMYSGVSMPRPQSEWLNLVSKQVAFEPAELIPPQGPVLYEVDIPVDHPASTAIPEDQTYAAYYWKQNGVDGNGTPLWTKTPVLVTTARNPNGSLALKMLLPEYPTRTANSAVWADIHGQGLKLNAPALIQNGHHIRGPSKFKTALRQAFEFGRRSQFDPRAMASLVGESILDHRTVNKQKQLAFNVAASRMRATGFNPARENHQR